MSSLTGKILNLIKPAVTDSVLQTIADLASNFQAIDDGHSAHLADNAPNSRGNRIYHVEVISSSVSETPDAGRIIFDTSQGKFFGGNGTEWV